MRHGGRIFCCHDYFWKVKPHKQVGMKQRLPRALLNNDNQSQPHLLLDLRPEVRGDMQLAPRQLG